MQPIRASQSTCFVASDYPIRGIYGVRHLISRGTFGGSTYNLSKMANFNGFLMYFSTNNFYAVKK